MIDWITVVAHGFWIAGLALILAALSYYTWLAGQEGRSLRQVLAGPAFQKPLLFGHEPAAVATGRRGGRGDRRGHRPGVRVAHRRPLTGPAPVAAA